MSADRLDIILEILRNHPRFQRCVVHWEKLPAFEGAFAEFPGWLAPEVREALRSRGISRLFSHQAEALEKVHAGKNVVAVTPTASGKTLCYNLPVVQAILENERSHALFLFPTKALSQDQYAGLYELLEALGKEIRVFTFDGDTPKKARPAIRTKGQIVISNPDMLHTGILPHHTLWTNLLGNLKYVVIDELHQYRGVFGSHFANVMRRLKRIAEFYGRRPQFICSSATIANPKELAEELVEEEFELIERSGAPRGEKFFILYSPPIVNKELGIRASVKNEARGLAIRTIGEDLQTIVFGRSRINVEVVTKYLKKAMSRIRRSPNLIRGYRGGYLPLERREIEKGIREGKILGVVSTNALELGIDIGQLRVAILMGYPGSIASTWQQAGRAGRTQERSMAVLIADSSPIDQYIVRHPEYVFGSPPEIGIVNPDNPIILASHIKCGVFELPFEEDEKFGRADPRPLLEHLEGEGIVRHVGGRWHWASEAYPAEEVSLRSPTVENFVVIERKTQKVIGEVDFDSAPYLIFPEAIYIHQSQSYFVEELDWDKRAAYVHPVEENYYTEAQAKTTLQVLHVDATHKYEREQKEQEGFPLEDKLFGLVRVSTIVAQYKKIRLETHENVGFGLVHLPEMEMHTEGCWLNFSPSLREEFEQEEDFLGALRGIAYLLGQVTPLYVLCDVHDVRTLPMLRSPYDKKPAVFVYDRYPGGIGIARKFFALEPQIVRTCREVVVECKCEEGCPSCIGAGVAQTPGTKESVKRLLSLMGS